MARIKYFTYESPIYSHGMTSAVTISHNDSITQLLLFIKVFEKSGFLYDQLEDLTYFFFKKKYILIIMNYLLNLNH